MSDAPLRALGSTSALKLRFSSFKADEASSPEAGSSKISPAWFESPHYPRLRYPLASEFAAYFRRYAKFRHSQSSDLSTQSLLLPLMDGSAGYASHTMIDLFSRFTTTILTRLQQSPLTEKAHWRDCGHLEARASITFLELRASAKEAGWASKAVSIAMPHHDEDVCPDIGIRKHIVAAQACRWAVALTATMRHRWHHTQYTRLGTAVVNQAPTESRSWPCGLPSSCLRPKAYALRLQLPSPALMAASGIAFRWRRPD